MEWSNDLIMKFLKAYHVGEITWNPAYEQHKDKRRVNEVLIRISEVCYHRPVKKLKKQKDSLMTTRPQVTKLLTHSLCPLVSHSLLMRNSGSAFKSETGSDLVPWP